MAREFLVFAAKTFKITIPDEAKVTFAPWSPPSRDGYGRSPDRLAGTLRIYLKTKDNIIGCFSGVTGFRDLSMDYEEEVAREEGAIIWKSDKDGYKREEKVQRHREWVDPAELPAPADEDEEEGEIVF